MLFLTNVDDEINCKDQAGAATGLPDLASVATGIQQQRSPVAYPVSPPQIDCSTKDDAEQTYNGNQFDTKYLLSKNKNDLHGAMIFGNDTKDAARGGQILIDTALKAGAKSDLTQGVSGRDPQSAYTPIINTMKSKGSNYSYNSSALSSVELERSEAQLQGLTGVNWVCTIACYDKKIKDQ